MTTTFEERLQSRTADHEWRFVFVIQGVPVAFTTDRHGVPDDVVALAGWGDDHLRHRGVVDFKVSKKKLDPAAMRMVGGSLELQLSDLVDELDVSLAELFAARSRRVTFLNDSTTASDIMSVDSATELEEPGIVYVGAETFNYSEISNGGVGGSDSLEGGTRGAFGSEARPHYGDTDNGAGVFTVPPMWLGRRVKMIAYFVDSEAKTRTTADLAFVVDTFRIESAPRFVGKNTWRIECSHLSDEVAARKLATGVVDVSVVDVGIDTTLSGGQLFVEVDDITQFAQGDVTTYLRGEFTDGTVAIWPILSVDTGTDRVYVDAGNQLVTGVDAGASEMTTARHIALLNDGNLGVSLLRALTSRVGDGANGDSDQLPGRERAAFEEGDWRFGAGVFIDEVDEDAFEDVGAAALTGWSFVIDDEVTVEEVLADFCLATASFWYVTPDGLLTVKRFSEERTDPTLTIDDDYLVAGAEPEVEYAEGSVWPRVSLQCNYDPASRDFEGTIEVRDAELADRYQNDDRRLELTSKAIVATSPTTSTPPRGGASGTLVRPSSPATDIEASILRRVQIATGRGRGIVHARCSIRALKANLAHLVLFTAAVPDLEGRARISGRTCRVIGIEPDFRKGFINFDLEILETLFHVAPACVLTASAGNTITLQHGGIEVDAGFAVTPGRMFGESWVLRIYDVSAGTFVDRTVAGGGVADDVLTFTAAAPSVEAGVDFVTVAPQDDNHGNATESGAGFLTDEFLYTMERDLAGADPVTRWR